MTTFCAKEKEREKRKKGDQRERENCRPRQTDWTAEQFSDFAKGRRLRDKKGGGERRRMRKKKKGKNFTNFAKNRYETNCDSLLSDFHNEISNFATQFPNQSLTTIFFVAEFPHLHNDNTIFVNFWKGIQFQVFLCR